ncbi:MAG: hypothetical protein WBV45_07245 [Lutimonas sp.]
MHRLRYYSIALTILILSVTAATGQQNKSTSKIPVILDTDANNEIDDQHIDYYGEPPSRSLYDMAAIAIVKNPTWGEVKTLRGIRMVEEKWTVDKSSQREILLWENFGREAILQDFYTALDKSSN